MKWRSANGTSFTPGIKRAKTDMMKTALILSLFLAGCTTYPAMYHAARTPPQALQDMEYCRAVAASQGSGYGGGLAGMAFRAERGSAAYKVCMMQKGYFSG